MKENTITTIKDLGVDSGGSVIKRFTNRSITLNNGITFTLSQLLKMAMCDEVSEY